MVLTLRERIFVTEQYFAHKSYKTVSEMFQAKFPGKDVSNKSTMSHIIAKFRQHGPVCNLPHNREKAALTSRVLARVSSELASNNRGISKSFCQVICEHRNEGLSYSTTHCAMEALGLHPYRVCIIHELLSWQQSPRDVLSMVAKLRTNLPWHVERCILFWWSMVSTVTVCEQPHPANSETLKVNIMHVINKMPQTMPTNVARNVMRHVRACISAVGRQFEQLF